MGGTIQSTIKKASILVCRAGRKVVRHPLEATLMIRMACWVTILSVLVKLTSLPQALQLVSTKVRRVRRSSEAVPPKLARAIDLLLGMDLLLFRKSCWKRAVILHRYLALNGIESSIKFGVRREAGGNMAGHAWLERQGESLLEVTEPEYTVTFGFPAEGVAQNQFSLPPELQH